MSQNNVNEQLQKLEQQLRGLEQRLRKLERRPFWVVVIAALAAIVISAFIIWLASSLRIGDVGIVTIGVITLIISLVVIVFLMRYYGED